ncbi:MAG TPA: SDR family oxidoreductase [Acidimicrobiia bacterium]|nr:SDR family oxidoreductase [Acidimicrobiia bacterium]
METGLDGAGVLVTGGAGGIGSAICRAFAAEGARVGVHHRSSGKAAAALADEIGGSAHHADLTSAEAAVELVDGAAAALGRLDVCVANAGAYPAADVALWEMDPVRWAETVTANLTVAFTTARAFLGHAARTGRGSLVLVASTAGIHGEAGHADYAAAKGAISSGLLRSLKNEASRIGDGVRVNAVAPGWTATPRRVAAGIDPDHVERATATMSLKKLATPEDVAAVVVALASDRISGHVTGQVVEVAGGMEGRVIP